MKSVFGEALKRLLQRLRTLLLFELLFQLFSAEILFPAAKLCYNACLTKTGIYCFTPDMLPRMLSKPLMVICLIFLFLFFTITMAMEHFCLVLILYSGGQGRSVRLRRVLLESVRLSCSMLKPSNLPMLLSTLLLLPVVQLSATRSLLSLMHISTESALALIAKPSIFPAVIVYALLLMAYMLLAPLVMTLFALEKPRAVYCFSESVSRRRGRKLRSAMRILLPTLISFLFCAFMTRQLYGCAANLLEPFSETLTAYWILSLLSTVRSFICSTVPAVVAYALIIGLYRKTAPNPADDGRFCLSTASFSPAERRKRRLLRALAVVVLAAFLPVQQPLMKQFADTPLVNWMKHGSVTVFSHRGKHPDLDENTLTAIRTAHEGNADYVEIDVRLTKDGEVLVQHDPSFSRVFLDTRTCGSLTLSQTRMLKSKKTQEPPPTLEEVFTALGPNAHLLIELKPDSRSEELVEKVYNLMKQYDMLRCCKIQSSSYTNLCRFKALSPETECGYILALSVGRFASLPNTDFFSIEHNYIDQSVVEQAHKSGKKIYAWTTNEAYEVVNMLRLGVDGLITDKPQSTRAAMLSAIETPLETLVDDPSSDSNETNES